MNQPKQANIFTVAGPELLQRRRGAETEGFICYLQLGGALLGAEPVHAELLVGALVFHDNRQVLGRGEAEEAEERKPERILSLVVLR